MANLEHVAKLQEGSRAWNQWAFVEGGLRRVRADFSGADLRGVAMSYAELRDADFRGANMRGAKLAFSNLTNADLSQADLRGALLIRTRFYGANLTLAKLEGALLAQADLRATRARGANFSNTNLRATNFDLSDLRSADFSGSMLEMTIFGSTDFSGAMGLDTCIHIGRSTIDPITLARSGHLPLRFLRGCGLAEDLITYLPSLLNEPIQFQSCFISYSTKDQEFADRLYADLQNKGVRCWFAPHDIQGGKKIHEQIDRAIQMHDRLLLLLSEHSMGSEWVKTEIATAREREAREGRQVLFPLALVGYEAVKGWTCFDADRGKDSAREIREYYVPDFSGWKDHDSYSRVFERLVRDLKAKETGAGAEPLG